jgi:hypothetical protein
MVAIVTLVFSLCWLPITFYIMSANVFEHKTAFLYYFKVIANSFAYLNSAVNPLIYAFLNRSFRNNCGNILSKPTCSLFCRANYHERQRQLSRQKDYSYQPAKGQIITIDNNIQLSPHDELSNDFSDAEYEPADQEDFSLMTNDKTYNENNRFKEQLGTLRIDTKTIDGRPLTTSL